MDESERLLAAAGWSEGRGRDWLARRPDLTGEFGRDAPAFSAFWRAGAAVAPCRIPRRGRNPAETAAAALVDQVGRAARRRFLAAHAIPLYRILTGDLTRFVRVEPLAWAAAEAVPGLVPSRADLAAEDGLDLADRHGHEIDQGLFLASVLADPAAGSHLCQAMLLPRPDSQDLPARLARDGAVDLGAVTVTRAGAACVITFVHPGVLNAEDDTTLDALERAVDLCLLDPASAVGILRGGPVDHPRHAGRRVFGAGINLTRLYRGRIPFLWYLSRDLGPVNKIFRGLARPEDGPDSPLADGIEKPWIAAVDSFAIGGACQLLLVTDHVLAEAGAYLTLPARKEGIIPGAANLRLPRFVGDRLARQAILSGRRIDCDSPEGRLMCDQVVAPERMDTALAETVAAMTESGVVSAAGNRRALRAGPEPLDTFRRYMAVYAREQAECHCSPALVANLEHHWNAAARRAR